MISKKTKAAKGPSWLEVGLGAVLSVALGVVVGAAYLVAKPVVVVKEIPKDAPSGTVYYIEGTRDFNKSVVIDEKRKSLSAGESVSVEEGELNALIGSMAKPSGGAKPGDKAAPPSDLKVIDIGTLNVRIRGGKIQLATPVTVNLFGASFSVIAQANGTFSRHGAAFAFDPETTYVGGCPVQHLPFATDYVLRKLLFVQPVPEDILAAWPKLADVSIAGSTMQLRMP